MFQPTPITLKISDLIIIKRRLKVISAFAALVLTKHMYETDF